MNKKFTLIIASLFSVSAAWAQGDLAAAGLSPLDYQVPGTKSFTLAIENKGTTGISNYEVYWALDNGQVHTVSKNAYATRWNGKLGLVNDPAFQVTLPAAGTHILKAWVKSIAPLDNNHTNDTVVQTINVYETLPKKNVVLEIYKHQGCGPCYDAAVYADTFLSKNPAYGIASVYTVKSEPLFNADGKIINDEYSYTHPTAMYDRFKFPFRIALGASFSSGFTGYEVDAYGEREQYYEPVQVYFQSVNWNKDTRELRVTVGAKFFDDLNGDFRFNVYLTEDDVKGYQAEAPDPNNFYHQHVTRAMLGGAWGKQGSLPGTLHKNDAKSYEFVYTIPQDYNTDKMHIIAMVQTYTGNNLDRRILNSEHKTFSQALQVTGVAPVATAFNVYPNPARDYITISTGSAGSYTLRLLDVSGKIYQTSTGRGNTKMNLQPLPAGHYFLYIDDGNIVHTHAIVKE